MTSENEQKDLKQDKVLCKSDAVELDKWVRNEKVRERGRSAPEGNLNSISHGIYASRFLAEDEKKIFDKIIAQLYKDFVFNKSSDFMQVELVAVYFIKLSRAQEEGNWDAAERLDRMIRCHLKDLKTTKITREGELPNKRSATPAQWASALVKKLADEKNPEEKPSRGRKRKKDGA
jgi:hypothetical protein